MSVFTALLLLCTVFALLMLLSAVVIHIEKSIPAQIMTNGKSKPGEMPTGFVSGWVLCTILCCTLLFYGISPRTCGPGMWLLLCFSV